MTPFSLEQARAGKAVVFRGTNKPVHFVGCSESGWPVVEFDSGNIVMANTLDLAMAPETHTKWMPIDTVLACDTKAEAENRLHSLHPHFVVAKVTWEA